MKTKNKELLETQTKTNPVLERVERVRSAQGEPVNTEAASRDFSDKSWDDTYHWIKY